MSTSERIPKLCHHKASGKAVVRLNGEDHYLGMYGTKDASAADALARAALEKRAKGQQPTEKEASALRRWERDQEEKLRWKFYAATPQKHWRAMSGRQWKVIAEQAARYARERHVIACSWPRRKNR